MILSGSEQEQYVFTVKIQLGNNKVVFSNSGSISHS